MAAALLGHIEQFNPTVEQ